MARRINVHEFIPESYRDSVYAPKMEYLGADNIRFLIRNGRRNEKDLGEEIRILQSRIDEIDGKKVGELQEIGSEHENSASPGSLVEGRFNKAWLTGEWKNTTLEYCGWCKYAENCTTRNGCNMEATCGLITDPYRNGSGFLHTEKFRFDTPCAVTRCSQLMLESHMAGLKAKRERLKAEKERVGNFVVAANNALKQAEQKPCFAGWRPSDYFKVGDEVMLFSEPIIEIGKVIDGYRCGDSFITVHVDKREGFHGERETLLPANRPEILKPWEVSYLKYHYDYRRVWLMADITKQYFNPEVMDQLISSID